MNAMNYNNTNNTNYNTETKLRSNIYDYVNPFSIYFINKYQLAQNQNMRDRVKNSIFNVLDKMYLSSHSIANAISGQISREFLANDPIIIKMFYDIMKDGTLENILVTQFVNLQPQLPSEIAPLIGAPPNVNNYDQHTYTYPQEQEQEQEEEEFYQNQYNYINDYDYYEDYDYNY
jgi:hypothetical protein